MLTTWSAPHATNLNPNSNIHEPMTKSYKLQLKINNPQCYFNSFLQRVIFVIPYRVLTCPFVVGFNSRVSFNQLSMQLMDETRNVR